jgi:transposase, IS5 family
VRFCRDHLQPRVKLFIQSHCRANFLFAYHELKQTEAGDAGYRGHNAPPDYKFKVYAAGQRRRVTPQIKHEFKRRAAIEPVIGHLKENHRMGRNHLAHASGDAINAVLAAVGYNFRRLLAWLSFLLLRILIAFVPAAQLKSA